MALKVEQGLRRWLERIGLRQKKISRRDFRVMRAALQRRLGIDLVIDVGANAGQYGGELRRFGYAGRIVSVEPLPGPFASLSAKASADPAWTAHNAAAGRTESVLTMNITQGDRCSSLLKPTEAFTQTLPSATVVGTHQVPVRRLDDLCGQTAAEAQSIYLKLDVQGYELEALAGAERVLSRAAAVEAELSVLPCYEGGPTLFELVQTLHGRGFELVNVHRVCDDPATGRLVQMDGIFEKILS